MLQLDIPRRGTQDTFLRRICPPEVAPPSDQTFYGGQGND
jgi:hypothetical protein